MFITDLERCEEITAGDDTTLREILNPAKAGRLLGYSIAHTKVKPGKTSYAHSLKSSEVYYIIEGEGEMQIDDEKEPVSARYAIYIPPDSIQKILNTGSNDLVFLCIVDPAWMPEDEKMVASIRMILYLTFRRSPPILALW